MKCINITVIIEEGAYVTYLFIFFFGGGVLDVDINELDLYIGNNKFTIFNVDYWLLIILDMIIKSPWLFLLYL